MADTRGSRQGTRKGRVSKAILTETTAAAVVPADVVPMNVTAADAAPQPEPFVAPAERADVAVAAEPVAQTEDVSAIAPEAVELTANVASDIIVEAASAAPVADHQTTTQNVTQGAKTMTDAINNTMNQTREATQQAAEQFRTVAAQTNDQSKAAMEKGARVVEEMADLTRGNIEAMVASSKTAAKYVETLTQGAADYNRRSFEQASATLRSFAEVKSPTDFFRLQSDFARSAFDQMVAESARVSETMVKMTGDVVEPITSRYSVAAERMKTMAA